MFRFYWPWLVLLLPLPLLARIFFPAVKNTSKENTPLLRFPSLNRIKEAFPINQQTKQPSTNAYVIILSLIWSLLVLAIMQPEKVDQYTEVQNKGYDIMLAVDISASMQALDFSTAIKSVSRLDVTKDVVGKFALGRQGDRVGLITFGENAFLHVPLTLDTLSVSQMLNDTVSGMAGNATSIGDAIGLSVRTLRERPAGSRVLVLLTDGEDNASHIPPLEAAKLAKQYGIRIYTIGVGKNGPVPFPSRHGGYGMVEMSIDEDLLKEIALTTGGVYFRATDQNTLQSVYEKINTMEKSESNQQIFLLREALYAYPLSLAMALLLLLALIPVYRSVTNGS